MSESTQHDGSCRNRAKNHHLTPERSWHLPHLGLASSHEPPGLHPARAGTSTHLHRAWLCLGVQVKPRRGKVCCNSSQHWLPKGSFLAVREASLFTEQMDFGAGKHVSM